MRVCSPLSRVILLHIFHLHFCFLCGLKYPTEIPAHILENIQKVNTDQIKDFLECKCSFFYIVQWFSLSSPILTGFPFPFFVLQQQSSLISNTAHATFAFFISFFASLWTSQVEFLSDKEYAAFVHLTWGQHSNSERSQCSINVCYIESLHIILVQQTSFKISHCGKLTSGEQQPENEFLL